MSDQLKEQYERNKEEALQEFFTFLKFESISSEEEHQSDLVDCAQWLDDYLTKIGFEIELWETSSHPVIFASNTDAGEDQPTLLIYNHYDVQPVDPLEKWDSPPFQPTIRDGEIYARGAQDNKGQCFFVIQALKGLMERDGKLPINIKLIIEGDEEVGSAGLSGILNEKKEALKADYLAVVDLGIIKPQKPAITLGIRGIVTMDVEVSGSKTDLHSGSHGGIVYNPIHALVELLNKVRDESGKIAIPGFYDDVAELSEEERKLLALDFDHKDYVRTFGVKATGGEKELTPLERAWLRPTLEVNGISGGYAGTGFKTVIPASAHAKISCRLVSNQDPKKIGTLVATFLEKNAPEGIEVKVDVHSGVGGAARAEITSPIVKAFTKAYEEVFGTSCDYIFEGGSIPITTELSEASGSEVVFVGLALPDDQIHAPNEHFGIDRLEKGCYVIAKAIENLAKT